MSEQCLEQAALLELVRQKEMCFCFFLSPCCRKLSGRTVFSQENDSWASQSCCSQRQDSDFNHHESRDNRRRFCFCFAKVFFVTFLFGQKVLL
jgi:hypothetical protein